MRFNIKLLLSFAMLMAVLQSCKHHANTGNENSQVVKSKIIVDESFQPIVDEELYIFKSLYVDMHPIGDVTPVVAYAPESSAIEKFLNDSVRLAVLARDLTPEEYKTAHQHNSSPVSKPFAVDAIALIVNQASNDTSITLSDIKKMLNGDTKKDKNIVFDNPGSGIVSYLKSLAGSRALKQKNIYSLKSNKEVIRYVSLHPDAIGIVGFSWLNDPDKDYADAVQKVKIVGVKNDIDKTAEDKYFTPSQNTLALKQYPLMRTLYLFYGTSKLGTEFAAFLTGDQGQRIILKSGLLPFDIPGREIIISKKIKTKADN